MCAPEYQEFFDKSLRVTLMQHNRARHYPYAYLPQEEQNIINIFLTKGSNNMYRQWVADGKKVPLERIIELTGDNQVLDYLCINFSKSKQIIQCYLVLNTAAVFIRPDTVSSDHGKLE